MDIDKITIRPQPYSKSLRDIARIVEEGESDAQALEQLLCGRGHTLVPFEESADAYIINTCTEAAFR